jgi:hypothetical protein
MAFGRGIGSADGGRETENTEGWTDRRLALVLKSLGAGCAAAAAPTVLPAGTFEIALVRARRKA